MQSRQRYPGHARQALHIAAACQGGAYAGKWTVVVDDDVGAGELDEVLWAMRTRFDPQVDIAVIQKAWVSFPKIISARTNDEGPIKQEWR